MSEMDYARARANMVDGQLRPNRVNDKALLARFKAIPRENFVATAARATAYADAPQPLTPGREMLEPLALAHLLQGLRLRPRDNVLVVASGSGYSAALLAGLVEQVVMVEEDKKLMVAARNNLLDLSISNVRALQLDPQGGAPKYAPYDAILLDVAAEEIPPVLFEQLKEKGRLAAVRRGRDGVLEACIYSKRGETVHDEALFETKGRVLPGFQATEGFVF